MTPAVRRRREGKGKDEVAKVDFVVAFAEPQDEEVLRAMLLDTGMDLAGEIEEHVVLRRGGEVVAGGRLYQAEEELFHLLVFAVAAVERGQGEGRRLLRAMSDRPWEYCRDAVRPAGGPFAVTTVARGEAEDFYKKCGFIACDFSNVPAPFDGQCEDCPDRAECNPSALVYRAPARC